MRWAHDASVEDAELPLLRAFSEHFMLGAHRMDAGLHSWTVRLTSDALGA
jgi:hypothetical protein